MTKTIPNIIDVQREPIVPFGLKAPKTLHRTTHSTTEAKPDSKLKTVLPKLEENDVFVPGSIFLIFDLNIEMGQENNTIIQNLSRNIVKEMKISYGNNVISNLTRYDLYYTYKDLFLKKEQRENMLDRGISSLNFRKLRTGAKDAVNTDAQEVNLSNIYNNTYKIPLNHEILDENGVLSTAIF